MPNSFRWKLTISYLLIIMLVLAVLGVFLSFSFKDFYLDNLKANLVYEGLLVAEMTRSYDGQEETGRFMQQIAELAGRDTDNRVTIVDQEGKVLGDSQFDPRQMEVHKNRPEIFRALKGETAAEMRYSETAAVQMLYVAVPFGNGEQKGVVRIAKALLEVESLYRQILHIILLVLVMTGILAFLLSLGIARWFSGPVAELTATVQDMARGNLKKRISFPARDELGLLAVAVNEMAENLEQNINQISAVNERLEALLANTVNGILMVDNKGIINYVNPVAINLLGFQDNVVGCRHLEVISNYYLLALIDQVREEGKTCSQEIILHKLGEKRVETTAIPLFIGVDAVAGGVLLVMNDISELKRLEAIRKDFVANVSHELKTPVASISGFAETLLNEKELEEKRVREFSGIIYEEAQRLSRLIKRLLELSRLESQSEELRKEWMDLNQTIENAIGLMEKRKKNSQVKLCFDKPENPVIIKGNAESIVQVMLNLLENAINFSPDGEMVKISIEEEENSIRVKVADKGEGIPEKELPRVFERFYRVDKARSQKTGGTGLGLAIVKHLVENHGGQVGVESVPGKGSCFYFSLLRE